MRLGGGLDQTPILLGNRRANGAVRECACGKVCPNEARLGTTGNDTLGTFPTGIHVGENSFMRQTMGMSGTRRVSDMSAKGSVVKSQKLASVLFFANRGVVFNRRRW